MTWKVSVRYTDEKHTRGVIDSIGHPTSRLEATIENDKYAGVFTWKKKKMPRSTTVVVASTTTRMIMWNNA